jgi:nicotinamidase/pyrazinamidase
MSEIEYGPGTTLLVVDIQNDFADPNGSLYVHGGEEIVVLANQEISAAVAAGSPVVYTQDWHPESTPHFAKDGGVWPVHCVGGTWGAELHPDLEVVGESVRKGMAGEDGYSGFTMRDPRTGAETSTRLHEKLREYGTGRVVIAGLATDYCVKYSSLDAVRLGYDVTVVRDAIAAVDLEPGDGSRALDEIVAAGVALA